MLVIAFQLVMVMVQSFHPSPNLHRINAQDIRDHSSIFAYIDTSEKTPLENEESKDTRTLYEILNASPSDSYQSLKLKYRKLVRQTHPDTVINVENDSNEREEAAKEFAKIAQAWSILSNPKERLRYDRSIKAKEFTTEFTSNVEDVLETGFKAAFQFSGNLSSMAKNAQQAGAEMVEQLDKARNLAAMTQKGIALKQRALREAVRYQEMQERLASKDRRNDLLKQTSTTQEKFTSLSAYQVIKSFDYYEKLIAKGSKDEIVYQGNHSNTPDDGKTVSIAIDRLVEIEKEYKETTRRHSDAETNLKKIERQIESALADERKAIDLLEDAKRRVENAQEYRKNLERTKGVANSLERTAYSDVDKLQKTLHRQQDRTKETLRRLEETYIWKENTFLREESKRAKNLSEKLMEKAMQLEEKAEKLRQQDSSS